MTRFVFQHRWKKCLECPEVREGIYLEGSKVPDEAECK